MSNSFSHGYNPGDLDAEHRASGYFDDYEDDRPTPAELAEDMAVIERTYAHAGMSHAERRAVLFVDAVQAGLDESEASFMETDDLYSWLLDNDPDNYPF